MSRTEKDSKDARTVRKKIPNEKRPPLREKGGHRNLVRDALEGVEEE